MTWADTVHYGDLADRLKVAIVAGEPVDLDRNVGPNASCRPAWPTNGPTRGDGDRAQAVRADPACIYHDVTVTMRRERG